MNLKLKRLVRTSSSEQYALFDLDQLDRYQQPETIGKLDMHYTQEGMYGTVLLWGELSELMDQGQRRKLVRALLEEIAQPMGIPNEYVVEFFAPTLDEYEVFHNVAGEEESDETDGAANGEAADERSEPRSSASSPPPDRPLDADEANEAVIDDAEAGRRENDS